jgi:predicted acyl esterase
VRFLDHYLKHIDNGWQNAPHLLLVHEVSSSTGRDNVPDNAGWQTSIATWADVTKAIKPLTLYLRADGRLALAPPTQAETADSYTYGALSANTPNTWSYPLVPGSELTYTTPRLTHDAEFLGSGSANLWMSSTAPETDVQITLSEVRPDGQEEFVDSGWLQLSHRKLDPRGSTVLRPLHTDLQSDAELLSPGVPVPVRVEIQPSDHVYRAGSAIRVSIDAPGPSLIAFPAVATNVVQHTRGMESSIVLGDLPGARAYTPLPACSARLNQPCRAVSGTVPPGSLDIPGHQRASRRRARR